MQIIWYIVIALVPGLFWLWYYRRKDRENPEPLKLIVTVFLWGMLATIPAIAIEMAVDYFFPYSKTDNFLVMVIGTILVVAPVEEILKFLVVKEQIYNKPAFNEPLDGIIYSITAALGFATFENIMVTFNQGSEVLLIRFVTATLLHALTGGIMGYYIGFAKFSKPENRTALMVKGVLVAIIIHATYNIIAAVNTPITIILLIAFLAIMYIILARSIKDIKKFGELIRLKSKK